MFLAFSIYNQESQVSLAVVADWVYLQGGEDLPHTLFIHMIIAGVDREIISTAIHNTKQCVEEIDDRMIKLR